MKGKYFALLLAVTVVLSGCSLKKDFPAPEELPESSSEVSQEEPEFLELTEEDFTRVDLNLNISDDPPPVEIHSANLGKLDFGSRLSPCKAPEYRDETIKQIMEPTLEHMANEAEQGYPTMSAEDIERWRNDLLKTCDTPWPAQQSFGGTVGGGKAFFIKNYDNLCSCHDTVLFSVDLETAEMKEVFAHEDPVEPCLFGTPYYLDGKLLYVNCEYSEEKDEWGNRLAVGHLMAIDAETGEQSEICSGDFEWIYGVDEEKLILSKNYYHGDSTDYRLMECDIETGQLKELWYGTYANQTDGVDVMFDFVDGELYRFEMDYENNTTTVICDDYKVTVNKASNLYFRGANKDRVMFVVDEYSTYMTSDKKLYTYDLKTRECLVSSFNGFGNTVMMAGDALVTLGSSSSTYKMPFYYIMPQIGTAFRGADLNGSSSFNVSGDTVFIMDELTNYTYHEDGSVDVDLSDTTVYWFEK
ncbi:MAG: hypothetical protein J6M48_04680 [Ruminococcus sp.]|nr:hypothetical protein [Ruminococcus sp.]